jgi:hypothetical protein
MFWQDFERYFTSKVGTFKYKRMALRQHIVFWATKVFMVALYIALPAYFVGI